MKTLFISNISAVRPLSFGHKAAKKLLFLTISLLSAITLSAQEVQPLDTVRQMDEVLVQAVRVTAQTPVTFSNITAKELAPRNLGQDIPILINYLPSVVTSTDAGNGIGYTSIRVRGSDASRINVTINGVPYNDSESHGTFWVNMGDFASSVHSLQLQRGVGTSTNGAGAFGASLNLLTDKYSMEPSGEISNSFGSFHTRKHTVKFSTGLMNDRIEIAGRLSNIHSDGYIDRASTDLKSYFLQGTYAYGSTLIKALAFGGQETTYQSWNGLEDTYRLVHDRTYNTAGQYKDEMGNIRFYDNEVDHYNQDHYQLHWNQRLGSKWSFNAALHYTIGRGYFEQYREDEAFEDYGLTQIEMGGEIINSTDLIRRRWLDNDFYGTTFSINYMDEKLNVIFGGAANKYEGSHFGEIIWARYASQSEIRDRYYDDSANKEDVNLYSKVNWQFLPKLRLFADLQYRTVIYQADGVLPFYVDDIFNFFNPKAGLTFTVNDNNNIYFSFARAHREPRRDDYENGSYKPEKLDDFELGWRYEGKIAQLNINGYYMRYKDQLVPTGALNDVGAPVYTNSDSYRAGIEIDATVALNKYVIIRPNIAVSQNRNINYMFQRDGVLQNLGNTHIAFSPNFVAGNVLTVLPLKNLQVSLLSKMVGDQYMGNIDSEASKLESYFVNDLNASWEIPMKKIFKSITLSALVNNIFNHTYESNGYFYTYDDDWSSPGVITTLEGAGFYPQAGRNWLVGATLKF